MLQVLQMERRKGDKVMEEKAEIRVMTKSLVDALLEMNTHNRKLKGTVLKAYERDIRAGHWMLTNQGIGVSKDGVLLDGQHRLMALRESGYPHVKCVIVWGLDFDSQKVVDQQAKRQARDVLRLMYNASVAKSTPAICNVIARYNSESGTMEQKFRTVTVSEMLDIIEEHGENIEYICELQNISYYAAPILAAGVIACAENPSKKEEIKTFLQSVEKNEGLFRTMPAWHLRSYIECSKGQSGGSKVQVERFNKTMRAIESHIEGKSIGRLISKARAK